MTPPDPSPEPAPTGPETASRRAARIAARIAGLPEPDRAALRAAAVEGLPRCMRGDSYVHSRMADLFSASHPDEFGGPVAPDPEPAPKRPPVGAAPPTTADLIRRLPTLGDRAGAEATRLAAELARKWDDWHSVDAHGKLLRLASSDAGYAATLAGIHDQAVRQGRKPARNYFSECGFRAANSLGLLPAKTDGGGFSPKTPPPSIGATVAPVPRTLR